MLLGVLYSISSKSIKSPYLMYCNIPNLSTQFNDKLFHTFAKGELNESGSK